MQLKSLFFLTQLMARLMAQGYRFRFFFLIAMSILIAMLSLMLGDSGIEWQTFASKTSLTHDILFEVRLPHTLNAFAIGGLLALCGYLMQAILGNPLADPFTLGTSGGAAVMSLVAMMLGFGGAILIGASFIGALGNMLLLLFLTGSINKASSSKLLLVGVVLAAGWGACITLALTITPSFETKPLLFWLFGDVDYQSVPLFALAILAGCILLSTYYAEDLHIMSQGGLLAKTLGVETEKLQLKILLLTSIMTATAVSLGGTIGFVGLIVPHCSRILLKRSNKLIFFYTAALGGTLLVAADVFGRLLFAPTEPPIGLLTTLLGIPFFLHLARKTNG